MNAATETAARHIEEIRRAALIGDCHVRQLYSMARTVVAEESDEQHSEWFLRRFADWNRNGRGS